MSPRLDQLEPLHQATCEYLDALGAAGFRGDRHPDLATRLITGTDNSVYQLLPQAVIYPENHEDVVVLARLANEERFKNLTFTARGGGTGTNGQSLSEGIIVDMSRRMHRILEVDLEAGWVRVEPGVVLDQLNRHLKPHGFFFAPNLSPSSRATIGGMIATDASGKGSRIYGRTSQHVLELQIVLADGTPWAVASMAADQLQQAKERPDRIGTIHQTVDTIVTEQKERIETVFPKLGKRYMTGYNLAMVRDEESGRFDLNLLLAGSEGTLAFLTEARLKLTRIPCRRRLIVLKYDSFDNALGSAELLVASNPGAIETVDDTILDLARQDTIWHRVGPVLAEKEGSPQTAAVNLVEYEGYDPAAVDASMSSLIATLRAHRGQANYPFDWVLAETEEQAEALWSLRKKGVGLLGNAPGPRKPVAFVEDTVVPPKHLRAYVQAFRAILDEAGLSYGMFGHVDVGCLHVRPALNLNDPDDERLLHRISDKVAALVQEFGGVIWGEHGKGFRSQYSPQTFGPELYAELCRIKAAFDPQNRLNPGKLAVPTDIDYPLASVDAPKRGAQDRQIPADVRSLFEDALNCNGNGACYDVDPDQIICPSSKITRDRVHSPKGRAGVLREWLRQLAKNGFNPKAALDQARPSLLRRLFASFTRRHYDFSHEVYNAMDGCLSCQACATQCPVQVDVPGFRSRFLALYHDRYMRPLRDHFIARLETVAAGFARIPRLANALTQNPITRGFLRHVVGIVDPPRWSVPTAAAGLAQRQIPAYRPELVTERTVALLPDAFTTYYDAPVLLAAVDVIQRCGYQVLLLPYRPSGKALHVKGFHRRFEKQARENAAWLQTVAEAEVPIVGVDPAVVLFFRREIAAMSDEPAPPQVKLLQEWLVEQDLPTVRTVPESPYRLFAHCTERATEPATDARWTQIFASLGLALEPIRVGCCGMCGAFGHERHHREESQGIYQLSWGRYLPAENADRKRVLATGYSCRAQVARFDGFRPLHPVEVLALHLDNPAL